MLLISDGFSDQSSADVNDVQQYLGNVAFMAPETIMGRCTKANFSTDIFALGVLCWSLLTNTDPSSAAPNDCLLQVQRVNHHGKALIDIEVLKHTWKPLIRSMISIDAADRLDITDILPIVRCFIKNKYPVEFPVKMILENGSSLEFAVVSGSKLSDLKALVKLQTGIPQCEQVFVDLYFPAVCVLEDNHVLKSCRRSFRLFRCKPTPTNGKMTIFVKNWKTKKFVRLRMDTKASLVDLRLLFRREYMQDPEEQRILAPGLNSGKRMLRGKGNLEDLGVHHLSWLWLDEKMFDEEPAIQVRTLTGNTFALDATPSKPIIVFRPPLDTTWENVDVQLTLDSNVWYLTHVYPYPDKGTSHSVEWKNLRVDQEGHIHHPQYPPVASLFWESESSEGYSVFADQLVNSTVVPRQQSALLLHRNLLAFGFKIPEATEMVTYWQPHMENLTS
ncbi:hypothetical protein GEMRC1_000461 [Eukaryota sp. GEM-RC1]